jgi:hypothetical protein
VQLGKQSSNQVLGSAAGRQRAGRQSVSASQMQGLCAAGRRQQCGLRLCTKLAWRCAGQGEPQPHSGKRRGCLHTPPCTGAMWASARCASRASTRARCRACRACGCWACGTHAQPHSSCGSCRAPCLLPARLMLPPAGCLARGHGHAELCNRPTCRGGKPYISSSNASPGTPPCCCCSASCCSSCSFSSCCCSSPCSCSSCCSYGRCCASSCPS